MNHQQIGLLVFQFVSWLCVLIYLSRSLLKSREESYKYKLYALRDQLLYLVANGKVSETSIVFKTFYGALSKSIGKVDKLTIYSLLEASVTAKTALQKEKQARLMEAIERSPEMREFVDQFATVMMEIMMGNCPELRFTLWVLERCGQFMRKMQRWVTVPADSYEIYRSYRYFEQMHSLAHHSLAHR